MINKIVKIGNSTGVTLPKKLLSLLEIELGEDVFIESDLKNRTIIIKPIQVARGEVNPDVIKGMKGFTKKYSKALKKLAEEDEANFLKPQLLELRKDEVDESLLQQAKQAKKTLNEDLLNI